MIPMKAVFSQNLCPSCLNYIFLLFPRFDHHCKWLNTCVGEKNYKYFLVSIFSVCVFTSITLGLSMGYAIEAFAFQDSIIERLDDANEAHAISINLLKVLSLISAFIMVSCTSKCPSLNLTRFLTNLTFSVFIITK